MIELAQHIEVLLLENDCVIVPGLGGFVAHYTPATRVEEEGIFLPPTRVIGFNSQLNMNDGLLVQSYMSVYGTNFSDATKMVERKVDELIATLHENGKVDLFNVGEVRYTIHNTFDFVPYNNKITTPYLYGLDMFEMQELTVLKKSQSEKAILLSHPVAMRSKGKRSYEFKLNPAYLVNTAAVAAVIFLFFFFSIPIENTEVIEENYANLLPDELFEKIEKQSLVITPIVVKQTTASTKAQKSEKKMIVPVAVKEIKVPVSTPAVVATTDVSKTNMTSITPKVSKVEEKVITNSTKKSYHVIIASVGSEKDAQSMAAQLINKGYSDAKAIIGDGKMRVSIQSCETETEAYQILNKLRQNEVYQNAWVLKR